MAEDYLSAQKVQQLTELAGRAKVTFPYDAADYPVIERIHNVPWEDWQLELESPDEEYPGAILILQQKLAEDDQEAKVYRRWETLPGPHIPFTRYDDNLGPIQGQRRAVLSAGQTASLTATGKITYEARDTSALVAWEVQEGWSNGTGSSGNPLYPINYTSSHDPERGVVDQTSQIVAGASGLHGSITFDSGTGIFTEIAYQPFNEFLDKKVISIFTLPAEILTRDVRDDEKGPVQATTQLVAANGSEVGSSAVSGGIVTDISYEPINDLVLRKRTETFAVPCPIQTRYETEEETGRLVAITTQIIATPLTSTGYGYGALGVVTAFRPITSVYGRKVITTFNGGSSEIITIERTKISPYRYPPLVFGIDGGSSGLVVAQDGTTRLVLNWLRRGGRVSNVPTTTVATYGAKDSLTLPTGYFDPVLSNLIYNGVFVNVSETGVLNDTFSFFVTTDSDNPKWNSVTETVGFTASALSATGYMALVNTGSIQIVAAEKEDWKYGLWRMVVTKVPIR